MDIYKKFIMKNYLKFIYCFAWILLGWLQYPGSAWGCTSVIVSGKVTKDGRPLLFKNRDTGNPDNLMVSVQGEKYKYIGIATANDSLSRDIWAGHNEAGFAIMNTTAYNLNREGVSDKNEGYIMKRALEICATLKDFENMLDTMPKPLLTYSNYGVIDAQGGCSYYETGSKGFVKFDANDNRVAPQGYLIRTNFGYTGDPKGAKGVERYMAISDFMLSTAFSGNMNYDYMLSNIPRNLKHGLTKINLYDYMPENNLTPKMFPFRDFIPRYQTASTILIQGVKQGESPLLTVSWTIIGSPMTTVAIPLCILPSGKLPTVALKGNGGYSELCKMGLDLKKRLFPLEVGSYTDYIDLGQLINKQGTGIMQQIIPIEKEIKSRGLAIIERARDKGKFDKAMDDYYIWVDDFIRKSYSQFK